MHGWTHRLRPLLPCCLCTLQISIFLGAMDSSCGQPQGLRKMDRRQNFDVEAHILQLSSSYWNSHGNSIWLFQIFWNKKIRILVDSNWKASICLIYIGYIFSSFSSELWGSLWLPSRLDNVYCEKNLIYDIIRGRTQWSYILLIKYILNSSADSTHLLQLA